MPREKAPTHVRLYTDHRADGMRLYYSREVADYVEIDEPYTIWTMAEWTKAFAFAGSQRAVEYMNRTAMKGVAGDHFTDAEGRHWEFFGYDIPLYDDNEKL